MERGKLTIPIEGTNVPFYPYTSFDEVLQTADDENVTLRMVLEGMDAAIALLQSTVAQKADAGNVYTKNQTYTKSEVNNALSAKADKTDLDSYLPLSGGTMSDTIYSSVGAVIRRKGTDGYLQLCFETVANGARINLFGKDYGGADAGGFGLVTGDGSKTLSLSGNPNGRLKWAGQEIERVEAFGTDYIRYTNGLQICWGTVTVSKACPANNGITDVVTYSQAFSTVGQVVANFVGNSSNSVYGTLGLGVQNIANNNFTVAIRNGSSAQITPSIRYIAVGNWK